MSHSFAPVTSPQEFYGHSNPQDLAEKYGTPLYVYNESILRQRCREMKNLVNYSPFIVNYSAKANSNLELLRIIREEGLCADAMSPGEIFVELRAGFAPGQILFISNNVDPNEMRFAIEAGVGISVDAISQLDLYGRLNPGGSVMIRFNPGIGAGHHQKVITAGSDTKFGVDPVFIKEAKTILKKHRLRLTGINQHIGSLFMEGKPYLESVRALLGIAKQFDQLELIDLGGGFGIPYRKIKGEKRLNLAGLGKKLNELMDTMAREYGKKLAFKIEPGRYIAAECGVLLGRVNATKINHQKKYVGTDIGFNAFIRPALYDAHHDIEIYHQQKPKSSWSEKVTIVGNICETGDIIAKERLLPPIYEGDIIGVLDAGAYAYAMSSNYNNRLRPAEVLITEKGEDRLIRRREVLQDLLKDFDT